MENVFEFLSHIPKHSASAHLHRFINSCFYIGPLAVDYALSTDGQPIDNVALREDRQFLVDQFNKEVGDPGDVVLALQTDFINGTMPYDDMISYFKYCRYMITVAKSRNEIDPTEN